MHHLGLVEWNEENGSIEIVCYVDSTLCTLCPHLPNIGRVVECVLLIVTHSLHFRRSTPWSVELGPSYGKRQGPIDSAAKWHERFSILKQVLDSSQTLLQTIMPACMRLFSVINPIL
jgi:hypothetical protein